MSPSSCIVGVPDLDPSCKAIVGLNTRAGEPFKLAKDSFRGGYAKEGTEAFGGEDCDGEDNESNLGANKVCCGCDDKVSVSGETLRIDDLRPAKRGRVVVKLGGAGSPLDVCASTTSSTSAVYGSSNSILGYVILTGDALEPCLLGKSSSSGYRGGEEGGVIMLSCAKSPRLALFVEEVGLKVGATAAAMTDNVVGVL